MYSTYACIIIITYECVLLDEFIDFFGVLFCKDFFFSRKESIGLLRLSG